MRFVDSADGEESSGALVDRSFNGTRLISVRGRAELRESSRDRHVFGPRIAGNWTTLRNVTEQTSPQTKPQEVVRTVPFRTGAVIVIAVAVGLILWLALGDTGSGGGKAGFTAGLPE